MLNKVLIPLDGSVNAEKISGWSEGIAETFESTILLLIVVDPSKIDHMGEGAGSEKPTSGSRPVGESSSGIPQHDTVEVLTSLPSTEKPFGHTTQLVEQVSQRANDYVNHIAARLSERGFNVRAMVTVGAPEEEIIRVAKEEEVDLITMATHRGSVLARGILGSVTDRVITHSTVPVLAVRPEGISETIPMNPDIVMVALNGSELSEAVVPLASTMAAQMNAELQFVRVSPMAYHSAMGDAGIYYTSPISYSRAADFAGEYLEPFVAQAKLAGINASMRTPTGSPANTLIAIADENKNTMIVLGTRGQSGIKRLIVGSVTDKVIRSSSHPVLVIPSAE